MQFLHFGGEQCSKSFPGGKEPACQCRRHKRYRLDTWVRKIPWRRAWQPTPVFLPGESHGWRSLAGCRLWGCKESDTTEWSHHHHLAESFNDDSQEDLLLFQENFIPGTQGLCRGSCHPSMQGHLVVTRIEARPLALPSYGLSWFRFMKFMWDILGPQVDLSVISSFSLCLVPESVTDHS